MEIVTIDQAREHLRADADDEDDADLQIKINAATEAVLDYITAPIWEPARSEDGRPVKGGDGIEVPATDADGKKIVRATVRHAILLTVGYFYRERNGSQEHRVNDQNGYGYALPQSATALLYSLRKPTVV
ncbi:phage gp6-like head-tail connector protein [Lampropedia aestuarii]|uniref:Phage gp6-like head-tail connector protein n=1 Tax=Lampropedia aestuarii TaxID=2562762 RepID=A0A4S5BJE6_9BURK|nr:head-tail connector protein [Lampropedia aestuarii]THJ30945.1 phage gp6-like head-tail connector protein [Lampropedia aestuarii]